METLADFALEEHPDEPGLHVMIAVSAMEQDRDLAREAADHIAWAAAFGESPARLELVKLGWRFAQFRKRTKTELPTASLARERSALLADLAAFRPETEAEESRAIQLALWIKLACDEDLTADGMRVAPRILEIGDPAATYPIARALLDGASSDPAVRRQQRELVDALIDADPALPRYPAFLVLDARVRENELDARRALEDLLAGGLPAHVEDDAWVLYAGLHGADALPREARVALADLVYEERRHNTTVVALSMLANELLHAGRRDLALELLDDAIFRFDLHEPEIDMLRAEILAKQGRHVEALLTLQDSLLDGGTDYRRWALAARQHQKLKNLPEAVRLNQFYLLQVSERASGALPFGPPVSLNASLEENVKVWYRIVEMHPSFFGRSGVRQFVELLALIAAGLLAASRASRARAFLLPGALAAEIVFFAGFIALRTIADGASVPALSWIWLVTASLRAFVLVAGGLYVSAIARLPRHTRSIAGPALGAGFAALAGLAFGLAQPPLFVLEGMPGFARVAELGLAPEKVAEIPALLVSAMRVEAASRLVWPALVLTALPVNGILASPLVRIGRFALPTRETLAVVIAALLCSAGSLGAFPLAAAASAALVVARFRWGAVVPFLLHGAFVLGAVLGGLGGPAP